MVQTFFLVCAYTMFIAYSILVCVWHIYSDIHEVLMEYFWIIYSLWSSQILVSNIYIIMKHVWNVYSLKILKIGIEFYLREQKKYFT